MSKKIDELILNYIFRLLTDEQRKEIDNSMENDEELAELVEEVLDFCIDNEIKDKDDFIVKFEELEKLREDMFKSIDEQKKKDTESN